MTKREVYLEGGAPWGFRMNGGADSGHPLRISRVNPGSKAAQQGVREGDVISAINGTPTRLLTNGESHALLRSAGPTLTLGLNQDSTGSPKRRSRDIKRDSGSGSQETKSQNESVTQAQIKTVADTTTCISSSQSSKQGKKLKQRKQENTKDGSTNAEITVKNDTNELGNEESQVPSENQTQKMSSSKARRLRKARLKVKIKSVGEDFDISSQNSNDSKESSDSVVVTDAEVDPVRLSPETPCSIECTSSKTSKPFENSVSILGNNSNSKENVQSPSNESKSNNKKQKNKPDDPKSEPTTRGDDLKLKKISKNKNRIKNHKDRLIQDESGSSTQENTNDSNSENQQKVSKEKQCQSVIVRELQINPVKGNSAKNVVQDTKIINEQKKIKDKTQKKVLRDTKIEFVSPCIKETVEIIENINFDTENNSAESVKTLEGLSNNSDRDKNLSNSDLNNVSAISSSSEHTVEINKKPIDIIEKEVPSIEVVVNPPTPTLATENTFFGPDWESVEELDTSSGPVSSDEDVHQEYFVHFPPNDLRAQVTSPLLLEDGSDDYGLTIQDIRNPLIPPEEEERLRCFLETLDLTKPEEYDDSSSCKSSEEAAAVSVVSESAPYAAKEEIVIYKHCRSRCVAEPCYIPSPHRHYLDVITEENSDLSDSDKKSDVDVKPWEDSEAIRKNNEFDSVPEDWVDSDSEGEFMSDDGGIKSWSEGTTLDEADGIEIIYLDSDNSDDTIIKDAFLEETEPQLVVIHAKKINEVLSVENGSKSLEQDTNEADKSEVILPSDEGKLSKKRKTNLDNLNSKFDNPLVKTDNTPDRLVQKPNSDTISFINNKIEINNNQETRTKSEIDSSNRDFDDIYTLDLIKSSTGKCNSQMSLTSEKEEENCIKKPYNNELPLDNNTSNTFSVLNEVPTRLLEDDSNLRVFSDNKYVQPQEKIDVSTTPILSRQNSSSSGTATTQSTTRCTTSQSPLIYESEDKQEDRLFDTINCMTYQNPETLKELSAKKIISLPNGIRILEEVGIIRFKTENLERPASREDYNEKLLSPRNLSRSSTLPESPAETRPTSRPLSLGSCSLPNDVFSPRSSSVLMFTPPPSNVNSPPYSLPFDSDDQWVSVETSDENLRMCLSPSQSKSGIVPSSPKEAAGLLDLHKKFIQRRGYHEDTKRKNLNQNLPSPDLIQLEHYNDMRKPQDYTPELLSEAANLLALKGYRKSRFTDNNSNSEISVKGSNNFAQIFDDLSSEINDEIKKNELKKQEETLHSNEINFNKKDSDSDTSKESDGKINKKEWKRKGRVFVDNEFACKIPELNKIFSDTKGGESEVEESSNRVELDRGLEQSDGSRLLALIQSQIYPAAKAHCPIATTDLCNPLTGRCGEETGKKYTGSGDYVSGWLTMSRNITHTDGKRVFDADQYKISKQGDIAVMLSPDHKQRPERPKSLPPSVTTGGEIFRQKMYEEYMDKVAERYERRQQKVIKISDRPTSMFVTKEELGDIAVMSDVPKLEEEFMEKVKERMSKLGISLEDEDDSNQEYEDKDLPKHLQEFVQLTSESPKNGGINGGLLEEVDRALIISKGFLTGRRACVTHSYTSPVPFNPQLHGAWNRTIPLPDLNNGTFIFVHELSNSGLTATSALLDQPGVWSPAQTPEAQRKVFDFSSAQKEREKEKEEEEKKAEDESPAPAVWTPRTLPSPPVEKKTFRPINFESPPPVRKSYQPKTEDTPKPPTSLPITPADWTNKDKSDKVLISESIETHRRLTTSQSAESSLATSAETTLPRAPNPTITLLQKAREGQLPRGAHYLEDEKVNDAPEDKPHIDPNEIIYTVRKEYSSETEDKQPKKIVELGPRKFEGIGPTTKEGIPIVLRSEVKDTNQQKWYKRMYDSLHRAEKDSYPYSYVAGYLSEPDRLGTDYDSDATTSKYATLDRRRIRNKENDFTTSTMPRSKYVSNSVKNAVDVYKNQPGRIEDYEPGHSSISEKEAKQWWDEVFDIFDEQFEQSQKASRPPLSTPNTGKPFMTYALKESGYESDSTLVFKRRDENLQNQLAMSPAEQKIAYKTIQKGGEVPLHGLRKPAPERPKDETELEYFPISPHLTRIRIHKTKQNIKPIKEIICYPITSIKTDNPPPVFSTFKRTARPSMSLSHSQSPEPHRPPSPPKRQSSKSNSALRLYSKMSVSPYPRGTYLSRKSSGLEADSNVQYLKERIAHKLGGNVSLDGNKVRKLTSSPSSASRSLLSSRKESPSPGVRRTSSTSAKSTPSTSFSRKSVPDRKTAIGSLRSRREQAASKLNLPSDLRAPAEVRKVLRDREAKEKSSPEIKPYPPGTVVKSSTTLYSSSKNSKKPKEDKSLRVTVAISAKGREILRASSFSSGSTRDSGIMSPRRVSTPTKKSERDSKSPSPSLVKPTIVKSKTPPKQESSLGQNNRKRTVSPTSSKILKPITSKIALKTDLPSEEVLLIKKTKKNETSDSSKKKKEKNGHLNSKPLTIIKNLTSKKSSSEKTVKDTNGKKKGKKKSDNNGTESVSSKKISKKSTGKIKTQDKDGSPKRKKEGSSELALNEVKSVEIDDTERGVFDLKVDPIADSRAIHPLRSDSFFQHLFLRNTSPTPSNTSSLCYSSSVLERAKRFCSEDSKQRISFKSEPSLKLLSVYLNHKKPVTESKFRSLDREITSGRSSRSLSPYYTRGRSIEFFERIDKFDRMNNVWDQSVSSVFSPSLSRGRSPIYESKERSSSEPPRSSPTHDLQSESAQPVWEYNGEISPTLSRSPSCRRIRNARTVSRTIESIGGLRKKGTRAKSVGEADRKQPASIFQSQSSSSLNLAHVDHGEYQSYVIELLHSTKKSPRFKELHKFYSSLERMGELERTTSNTELRPRLKGEEVIDYDRWKQLRTQEKAEQELKYLYEKLKEDQKEKGLLFRPREPEHFRWRREQDRGLRNKEKSVEDLKNQFHRLTSEESDLYYQKRKDLELKTDVYKPLWRGSSVVNLASSLTSSVTSKRGRPVSSRDEEFSAIPRQSGSRASRSIGSRLWSSLSMDQVNALKHQLSEIYSTVSSLKRERIDRMVRGKNEREAKEGYEISVPPKESSLSGSADALHVRCNSLLTSEQLYSPHVRRKEAKRTEVMKADSISSIPQLREKSESSGDSQTSSIVKPLSENEKRRLSLTLSQEILDRVSKRRDDKKKKKRTTASLVIPRETLGAVAAVKGNRKLPSKRSPAPSETNSPRTCYSIEMSEEGSGTQHTSSTLSNQKGKSDFLLVLTPKDDDTRDVKKVVDEWAGTKQQGKAKDEHVAKLVQTSNSETDSGSSEASTVIHLGSRENVQKKPASLENKTDTFTKEKSRKSRSDGDVSFCEKNLTQRARSAPGVFEAEDKTEKLIEQLSSSQSVTDLKELFGEKYATLYNTSSKKKPALIQVTDLDEDEPQTKIELRPPSPVPHSSDENICVRSRSVSPDPMKYYRAYLNMVKAGDVRKLRDKFESLDDILNAQEEIQESSPPPPPLPPKKFQSDPDLTRDFLARRNGDSRTVVKGQEFGDVKWLKRKYELESKSRSRQKTRRVVSPVPLRAEDRFMPHINVISKMATLQQKRSSTAPARSDVMYRTGEVDRIRQQFEAKEHDLSLLGQMFTSTPDVRELQDIAPYLECDWVAHQHSKPRSLSSPETQRPMIPSPKPRPASSSPIRRHSSSILKPRQGRVHQDIFANQQFDPTIHRPLYRYQPPVHTTDPVLHYRPWRADPNWWWRNMYTSSKPTVTFQEPISGGAIPVPERDFHSKQQRPESPHRYVESEVTIHYRSPVRSEAKEAWSEEELARRQAEAMRRIYQEERRRKYLQELQDMYSRRHTDNFIPSQKSPIPLNRYDDFLDDVSPTKPRDLTPEPKLVARALYNFVGQSSRELTFRRGDVIFVRRQIDKNWYEGEHNAMIGLFPINYVEIIPYDGIRTTPKRPSEGQARAKFNFQAQTHLELSLVKGELVVLTRRVDDNWFEGRIGSRKGIFPVSYVEVLVEPGDRGASPVRPTTPASNKPVASPAAHSLMLNGGKNSLSHHHYTPPPPVSYTSLSRPTKTTKSDLAPMNQALHIDTQSEPVPYRALYNYKPQNDDELELNEGDTVYVMEKCDDGWYVGSSQRTGCFGTFPGNYVQRLSRGH